MMSADERRRFAGWQVRPYVEPGLLTDTMRTARETMRACVALDGELRPQALVRDARGHGAGVRVELSRLRNTDELRQELHRELPALLLELGARAVVLVCDEYGLALAQDRGADVNLYADPPNFYAVGVDAAGGVALALAPAERNAYGDLLVGESVLFDAGDRELFAASVPAALWRGVGFCAN